MIFPGAEENPAIIYWGMLVSFLGLLFLWRLFKIQRRSYSIESAILVVSTTVAFYPFLRIVISGIEF